MQLQRLIILTFAAVALFISEKPAAAQQQCATVSPTNVNVPAGGGQSPNIVITTNDGANCGGYAPAYFELAFVSCINCIGLQAQTVSINQLSDGNWQFTYYVHNGPNLTCAPSTNKYVDGLGQTMITATQNSLCQGISGPGEGPSGTPTNPQSCCGDPVSTGNGNYYYVHTDLKSLNYNPSLPLIFQRSYNSLDTRYGPLGKGWTNNYNITVNSISSHVVGVQWGDGHSETYTLTGGAYVPQHGATNSLVGDPITGQWTLTTKTGVQYLFIAGLLVKIQDPNGRAIEFVRSATNSGPFYYINYDPGASGNSGQQRFTFTYDPVTGRLKQVTDGGTRTVLYAYSASGDLISETDPAGNLTQYSYDSNGHLASITLPNTRVLLRNTYDASGHVLSQTNARGYTTTLSYHTPAVSQTTITDPLGNKTIHTYDSSMRITRISDPLGHASSYTYDAHNNVISITDARGHTSKLSYDSLGNVLTYADQLGNTASFSYNSFSEPLTITTPKGNRTTLGYDGNGNLTTVRDPLGHERSFSYSSTGQLISSTDPRGDVTSFSYGPDIPLAVTGIIDALGNQTILGYDPTIGRLRSIYDPNKNTSTIAYDPLGRIVSFTDPLGDVTQYSYDSVSNLTSVTDANAHATTYAYDPVGNLTEVTDALARKTSYSYDKSNNRISITNANGRVTKYLYDKANRLVKVTDPLSYSTSYGLDADGNVTTLTDGNGKKNTFTYDANNRLTVASYSDGTSVTNAYDADGNRESMLDSQGTTAYDYDDLDRVTSIALPRGELVGYAYDAAGNRDGLTYPDKAVLKFTYDADNRLSGVTDWKSHSTSYSYDPASNLTTITFPNAVKAALTYDAANRLTGITDSANSVAYRVLAYALDNVGNRTSVTDGGVASNYTYDAVNELLTAQSSAGKSSWAYDAVGNRTKQVKASGTTDYTYDADNRMLTAGSTAFTYDHNGNRLTETASSGDTTYEYDANNRLLSVAAPKGTSRFTYDGDGNRITQTTPSGAYDYLNDTAVGLPVVLNEKGPDGTIDYAYGLGLLESSSSAFDYFYNLDGLGSVLNLTNTAGKVVETYSYDAWGNALTATGSVGTKNKFRFTGQALDPATGLYFLRARYYEPTTGRFLSKDPFPGFAADPITLHHYLYAGNNSVRFVDPAGLQTTSYYDSLDPGNYSGAGEWLTFWQELIQRTYLETPELPCSEPSSPPPVLPGYSICRVYPCFDVGTSPSPSQAPTATPTLLPSSVPFGTAGHGSRPAGELY